MSCRSLLLLLSLGAAPALAQETAPAELARELADAWDRRDTGRFTLLAAEPAGRVSYARVVERLLRDGRVDVAEALARERGAAGPEGPGLLRLVQAFRAGLFPRPEDEALLVRAQAELRAGRPAEAQGALDALGEPREGTLFGVRLSWVRAQLLDVLGRGDEARAELARCARLARAVGEWSAVRDAEHARLLRADTAEGALATAGGLIEAAERLDDRATVVVGLRARAGIRTRIGAARKRAGKHDEARAEWKAAREDYLGAADRAEKAGDLLQAGLARRDLALLWQVHEGQPRQALKTYEEAIGFLRRAGEAEHVDAATLNVAILLTDLARYDEALGRLEELLAADRAIAAEVRERALAQRAYVLGRTGRVESARAAYAEALAAAKEDAARAQLLVQAGDVELLRLDLDAAEGRFGEALELAPGATAAWVGRARVHGLRGEEEEARAAFANALDREADPARRARWLAIQATELRRWGRIDEALGVTAEALKILVDPELREYANAGAAWQLLADLTLLKGDYEKGAEHLAKAGTIFYRLDDPYRAIDLYAQETLTLVMLRRPEDAIQRLQVLLRLAETTPSDALKSVAKSTEAIFEAREGRGAHALELLLEAEELARAAGDRRREATALVNRAFLEPERAVDHVRRALALLDAERVAGPAAFPLVEGYYPDRGPAIALNAMLQASQDRPAEAFALMERAHADRLVVALHGRDAVLAAGLPAASREAFARARGGLMEARATGEDVAAAEAAFDAMVAELREKASGIATLAWPQAPALGDVQRVLRDEEALVMPLVDAYVRCVLVVDRKRAVLRACGNAGHPLASIAELLAGKRTIFLAPGGGMIGAKAIPEAKGGERPLVVHVPTAAFLVGLRTMPREPGEGAATLGPGPARLGRPIERLPGGRLQLLHARDVPESSSLDIRPAGILRNPMRVETVIVRRPPGLQGAWTLAAALLATGTEQAILAAPDGPVDALVEGCLDRSLPPAKACEAASGADPDALLFFGAPD